MKQYLKQHRYLLMILYVPFYLTVFFLLEKWITKDYWVSYLPLDDKIPFVEQFVIFYCCWYPSLVATGLVLLFHNVDEFKKYMWFIIAGFSLSMLICAVFPNGQDLRPASFDHANFYTWLIGKIYKADTNTNVFPSMHVVGCGAVICGVFGMKPKRFKALLRAGAAVLMLLIVASTVFIKQHSILDIYGGIALCIPIWFVIYGRKHKILQKGVGERAGKGTIPEEGDTDPSAHPAE